MRTFRRSFVGVAVTLSSATLLATALAALSPGGTSPYASALSIIAAGTAAEAAPTCTDRVCDPSGAVRCVHQNGSHTNCGRGDFCRQSACP